MGAKLMVILGNLPLEDGMADFAIFWAPTFSIQNLHVWVGVCDTFLKSMTKSYLMVGVGGVLARQMPRLIRLPLSEILLGKEFTGFQFFQPKVYPA